MRITTEVTGSSAILRMMGSFNMDALLIFRNAHRKVLSDESIDELTLEMSKVDYIDSSSLGVLLLLHGETEARQLKIVLKNCQPFTRQVLTTANFHKLFSIA